MFCGETKDLFIIGMKRAAKDMEIDEEMDEELDTSLNVKDLKSKTSPRKKVAKIVTEIEADAEMEEN